MASADKKISESSDSSIGDEQAGKVGGQSKSSCDCPFDVKKHKDIFVWKDPFKTAAILTLFGLGALFKTSLPIVHAVGYYFLSMLIISGLMRLATAYYPGAASYHSTLKKFDRAFFEKLYTVHALPKLLCFIERLMQLVSFDQPIKSVAVGAAVYAALCLVSQRLLTCLVLVALAGAFGVYPLCRQFGVNVDPALESLGKVVCSTAGSIAALVPKLGEVKRD